jgi:glucose/arabinose dehydrogenase
MDMTRLLLFGEAHLLVAAAAATIAAVRRRVGAALIASATLAGVAVVTMLASVTSSSSYLLVTMLRDMEARNGSSIVAVGLGLASALPWLLLAFPPTEMHSSWKRRALCLALAMSPAATISCIGAIIYRDSHTAQQTTGGYGVTPRCQDPRFEVEEVATFGGGGRTEGADAYPICVAVDEQDQVFVSVVIKTEDDYSGEIVKLVEDRASAGRMQTISVAESSCLFHVFGLAVRNGEVFVSRSGFLAHARKGRIEYEKAGAITRLRDLDRDGVMDYYEDVVQGLPGSQGPVTQHSNNAITFGPDGNLYFTQGVHSDRDVLRHPWEGKILRASPDFQKVTIFASGLRNPFGLVHGPGGDLFATDNDVALGNPGDELDLIREGADYGHPYVVGDDDGGGMFVKPLLLWRKGSFGGMAYTESPALPAEYRGCLYIADYVGQRVLRVTLTRKGESYVAEPTTFVRVPSPIGVAVTRSGDFYITSFAGSVFRVRRNVETR